MANFKTAQPWSESHNNMTIFKENLMRGTPEDWTLLERHSRSLAPHAMVSNCVVARTLIPRIIVSLNGSKQNQMHHEMYPMVCRNRIPKLILSG